MSACYKKKLNYKSKKLNRLLFLKILHYVIKFVSYLWQVCGFLHNKSDSHDITEILLKVALNTITLTPENTSHLTLNNQSIHLNNIKSREKMN